ncbi:hypothetical protein DVK85_01335 [Flavobacterium arcticum]|uniref:Uncharacterized protein n=1 Tax=Flavobacterium arcticum TaxID=1784713 RepID=A0A345H8N5_9FLAO|nr:hypothetical protein [Flavobacterium arcticum]AXG72945.1 hypothetical protein DVK85_01335 [Flavobacterium arcticum]KAF2510391.1 hypothetical protein E0W72_07870 [Flavobacterium arcticum]
MVQSGFVSLPFTEDDSTTIEDVTSLTISNYGTTALTVSVNGVPRTVPAFNADIGVPFGSFNIPGDGTATAKLEIKFAFVGGTGNAILDYRKLIHPLNC